MEVGYRLDLG